MAQNPFLPHGSLHLVIIADTNSGHLLVAAKRIAIVGPPGSGKSTFASDLQSVINLPLCHLDDLYWLPGWRRPDPKEFAASQRQIASQERWIIDGNYIDTLSIRIARADTVCVFDVSAIVAVRGFVARALSRAAGRRDSLPLAVRLDEHYSWRPRVDFRVLKTMLYFRTAIRPRIFESISRTPSLRAVFVLNGWRDAKKLVQEARSAVRNGNYENPLHRPTVYSELL